MGKKQKNKNNGKKNGLSYPVKYKKDTSKAEKRAEQVKIEKEQELKRLQEEARKKSPDYKVTYGKGPKENGQAQNYTNDTQNHVQADISRFLEPQPKPNTASDKNKDKKSSPRRINKKIVPDNASLAEKATAAYNFVGLPKEPLLSPINAQLKENQQWSDLKDETIKGKFKAYLLANGTYSGTISLKLENLTPLFIGTAANTDTKSDTFFSPTGKPVIPGSTLRGLMRNLFKIVTAGTMRRDEDFVDQHLYYRCIMATGKHYENYELFNEYALHRMMSEVPDSDNPGKTKQVKTTRKGFLFRRKKDSSYAIAPCLMASVPSTLIQADNDVSSVIWYEKDKAAAIWTGNREKFNRKTGKREWEKKYIRVLFNPDFDNVVDVPSEVIESYRNDKNRGKKGVDLLSETSENVKKDGAAQAFFGQDTIDRLAPCFYVEENGKVTSFGHGRSFRIPYRNSVGDKVPEALQTDRIDFADAVFGRKELWAGRVSFEDAELVGTPSFLESDFVKPLLSANPTSFQLYLKQSQWPPAHWDSDESTSIRGYKQYWHQKIGDYDWQGKTDTERNESVTHKIKPLKSGHHFTAQIHFRELSDLELGALLKVFSLANKNQDIVFKIGLGKSLGMGSVRMKATLHIDDTARYTQLFSDNGWSENTKDVDEKKLIAAFDAYAKEQLGKAYTSYETSLRELRLMLDWNNTKKPNWGKRVASMSGDVSQSDSVDSRFKERALLQTPEEIVK